MRFLKLNDLAVRCQLGMSNFRPDMSGDGVVPEAGPSEI